MIASDINRIDGHPKSDNSSKWFTSRTESCHYFDYIPQPQSSDISYVALSLCPKRGIRGSITINDEQIFIKPAAYYLDDQEYGGYKVYQLTDEHLVYKWSDCDHSGHKLPRGIKSNDAYGRLSHSQSPLFGAKSFKSSRKLLGTKTMEVYIISDVSFTKEFKDEHGSDWYQQLLAQTFDYFNAAIVEYTNYGSFSSEIGDINCKLVRFEVAESWSGDYRDLEPDDEGRDGAGYLEEFKDWIRENDRNKYDVHQLWSMFDFKDSAGWGSVGCVCNGYCSSNVDMTDGDTWNVRVIAHEWGHNYGADHDDDAGCDGNSGIMGFGDDLVYHGWSKCSVKAFEEYYDESDGLRCLNNAAASFSSNIGGSNGGDDDGSNDGGNDDNDGGNYYDNYGGNDDNGNDDDGGNSGCNNGEDVVLSGFNSGMNGEWRRKGIYNNKPYYERGSNKLFYDSSNNNIHIHKALGARANWYCEGSSITACTQGKWYVYNGGWREDSDAAVRQCGGGDDAGSDQCVLVDNADNGDIDGEYIANGQNDGVTRYKQKSGDYWIYYVDYGSEGDWWTIETQTGDPYWSDGWCGTQIYDIFECSGKWESDNGENEGIRFRRCGGTLQMEELECVKDNEYEASVCVYNYVNGSNYKQFEVSQEECVNDKAVYKYIDYLNDDVYYLHYNEYKKYVYSVDVTPQWILSKNVISLSGDAYCDHANLLQCVEGEWQIYAANKDYVQLVVDESMSIVNRKCVMDNDGMDISKYSISTVIVIVLIILLIAVVIIAYKSKRNKAVTLPNAVEIGDESEDEEEEEIVMKITANTML